MTEDPRGGSFETISDYVSTAQGVITTGKGLDEANTKAKLLTPFLRTLGWRVYDNEEVILEYSGDEPIDDMVDYALFGSDGVHAVVEAKQIGRMENDDKKQLRRYMRLFSADWGLLTNGEEYNIYRATDDNEETLVASVPLINLPESDEIKHFTRQSAYNVASGHDESTDSSAEAAPSDERTEASAQEKEEIIELSNDSEIFERLVSSIAPSVCGHEQIKQTLLLSLFGGVDKPNDDGNSLRGAIHSLFVHDSHEKVEDIVDYCMRLAPEPIYLSGEPASERVLPSSVSVQCHPVHDSLRTVDYSADVSHVAITRFGQLDEDDIANIGGLIDATEPTKQEDKTSPALIVSSYPSHDRFDKYEPLSSQLPVEEPLISEFDLVFTITDEPDEKQDREVAESVILANYAGELAAKVENHSGLESADEDLESAREHISPTVEPKLLRKYIALARKEYFPSLTTEAGEALREFYVDSRSKADIKSSSVPVTVKTMETLVRLAEASARARLSYNVELEDAKRAIELVSDSLALMSGDPETGDLDADIIESGTSKEERDRIKNIKEIINELEDEYQDGAPIEQVYERAQAGGMSSEVVEHEIEKLRDKGEVYEPKTNHLRPV